jgi:hypothetical protein
VTTCSFTPPKFIIAIEQIPLVEIADINKYNKLIQESVIGNLTSAKGVVVWFGRKQLSFEIFSFWPTFISNTTI